MGGAILQGNNPGSPPMRLGCSVAVGSFTLCYSPTATRCARKNRVKHYKMELIATTLARLACFFEVQGSDPFGKTTDLQAIKELVKRYSFEKWPRQTFAEDLISLRASALGGYMQRNQC